MKTLGFRRDRRSLALIPAVALAGFLAFTAVAFACVPAGGQVTVTQTNFEPGDAFSIGASNLQQPGQTSWRVKFANNSGDCHHFGTFLGGNVVTDINGNISPVIRVIPTNATSGQRYLCWHRASDDANSLPLRITIL